MISLGASKSKEYAVTCIHVYLLSAAENEIDGQAFMELSEEDIKSIVPKRLGTVKKIVRLQKVQTQFCIQGLL